MMEMKQLCDSNVTDLTTIGELLCTCNLLLLNEWERIKKKVDREKGSSDGEKYNPRS